MKREIQSVTEAGKNRPTTTNKNEKVASAAIEDVGRSKQTSSDCVFFAVYDAVACTPHGSLLTLLLTYRATWNNTTSKLINTQMPSDQMRRRIHLLAKLSDGQDEAD